MSERNPPRASAPRREPDSDALSASTPTEFELTPEEKRLLERIPPRERRQLLYFSYSGPIPWPSLLRGYEEVLPGAADRIFTQFEEQGRHRREIERAYITGNLRAQTWGQVSATILALVGTIGGLALVSQDKSLAGLAAFFTSLAALAGLFVYGESKQRSELARKMKELQEAADKPDSAEQTPTE